MTYQERLTVPGSWWVISLFFGVSFVTAVGFYAGGEVALLAGAVTTAGIAVALIRYGRIRITVDADGLRVGDAWLGWDYLGPAIALDRAATRLRLGRAADPAAWLAVRGYLPQAVEVTVNDPADPHPYWLVSTRHAAELVAAIDAARPVSPDEPGR